MTTTEIVNFMDPEMALDPFGVYDRVREQGPVLNQVMNSLMSSLMAPDRRLLRLLRVDPLG
jgi:hypothetical protein